MDNIYKKIQATKKRLLEANLKKSGVNKFSNYTYYELADFLPTLIKICDEEGLFTGIRFDDTFAYLDIVNIEKPEEKVTYTSPMRSLELKGANAVQALGGVETYSRRYLYMAAFDIVENDMFDSTTAEEPKKELITKEEPKKELVTKEQANAVYSLLVQAGANDEGIKKTLEAYKVKEAEELTTTQYASLVKQLKEKIEANKKVQKPAETTPKKVQKVITEAQVKRLYTIANGQNDLAKAVLAEYGFTSSKDVTVDKYEEICNKIEEKMKGDNANVKQ